MYFYVAYTSGKFSYDQVGKEVGRDHASAIHQHKKIAGWLELKHLAKELTPIIEAIRDEVE